MSKDITTILAEMNFRRQNIRDAIAIGLFKGPNGNTNLEKLNELNRRAIEESEKDMIEYLSSLKGGK